MSRAVVAALAGRYRGYQGSGEHAAVAVLLGYPPVGCSAKLTRHASGRGLDWDGVLAETWPPGERLLVATAAGLWSGRRTVVDISRAAFLDEAQYRVWQAMLAAHRAGRVPAGTATAGGAGEARDDG